MNERAAVMLLMLFCAALSTYIAHLEMSCR